MKAGAEGNVLRREPLGLAKSLRHPALDFVLLDEFAAIRCFDAALDGVSYVDVVLNLLVRSILP